MKKLTYLIVISLGLITSCSKENDSTPQTSTQTSANPFGLTFANLEGTFKNGTNPFDYTIYSADSAISWQKTDLSKRFPTKYVIKYDTMIFYIKRDIGSTNLIYFKCKYSNDTLYGNIDPRDTKLNIINIKQK